MRIIGFCIIPIGYAVMGICMTMDSAFGILGMFTAFAGIMMVMRSFLHVKYRGLNDAIKYYEKNPEANYIPQGIDVGMMNNARSLFDNEFVEYGKAILKNKHCNSFNSNSALQEINKVFWNLSDLSKMDDESLCLTYAMLTEKGESADTQDLIRKECVFRTLYNRYSGALASLNAKRRHYVSENTIPIKIIEQSIYIESALLRSVISNSPNSLYELTGSIFLNEKTPTIKLYEDNELVQEYVLETAKNEDFSNQYFQICIRAHFLRDVPVAVLQIDGFVSENKETEKMTNDNVGYRFEGHYLTHGDALAQRRFENINGLDLYDKGLRYPGYSTPSCVRLIGVCQVCGKSITFRSGNIYLTSDEPVYSDDGLSVCSISSYETANPDFNKEEWMYQKSGKTYRYYNPFRCPHCGAPYIDYQKHPEMKSFGIAACYFLDNTVEKIDQ